MTRNTREWRAVVFLVGALLSLIPCSLAKEKECWYIPYVRLCSTVPPRTAATVHIHGVFCVVSCYCYYYSHSWPIPPKFFSTCNSTNVQFCRLSALLCARNMHVLQILLVGERRLMEALCNGQVNREIECYPMALYSEPGKLFHLYNAVCVNNRC